MCAVSKKAAVPSKSTKKVKSVRICVCFLSFKEALSYLARSPNRLKKRISPKTLRMV